MIATVLLLMFAWQNTAASTSQDVMEHMKAGIAAEQQQKFDQAILEFKKAAELDPTLPDAYISLGQANMELGNYGAAISPLKRAVELKGDSVPAHQLLGYSLLAQGYAAEAIPHLQRAGDSAAMGIAQIQTGQLMEAVSNLQNALAAHPNDTDLLYYLGRASGLLSKQMIDTLLNAAPDSARAHQAMAENYFVLRRMPDAEGEFQQALKLRPHLPEGHLELGEVYAGAFQWPKAEAEFREQTKLQPGNAEAAFRLGTALLEQGKAHEARLELIRADKLQPDMPETLYSLGKAASLDGDPDAAEKAWTRLLSIEKVGSLAAQAHFGLASIYRKQGKAEAAQSEMREFERLQGASPPQTPANPDGQR